jgi:ATP-dependent DNA ligase
MTNYARLWKDKLGFKEFTINEFIDKFETKKEHYIFEEKIDGQLAAFIYKEGEKSYLLSINNKKIEDIELIYEFEKLIKNNKFKPIKEIVIIGDLTAIVNNKILPFNQSQSIVKTPHKGNNSELIHHFVYDIFSINGVETTQYKRNLFILVQLFKHKSEKIQVVTESWGTTEKLQTAFDKLIGIHAPATDGIVIRTYNEMKAYKIKKKHTYDVVVIGIGNTKMTAYKKQQMSYLIVAFRDKNGNYILTSKIGTGFKTSIRSWFYDYAQKYKLYETDKGEIFFPPKIVAEVECQDIRKENVSSYAYKKNIYVYKGNTPSAMMRVPIFLRFREDKLPTIQNVRIEQII